MGLEPGPLFKRLLDAVREAQLDGTITSKKEAWSWWNVFSSAKTARDNSFILSRNSRAFAFSHLR